MLRVFAVHVVVSIKRAVEVAAGVAVVFIEGAEAVVLVDHIVQLQLR